MISHKNEESLRDCLNVHIETILLNDSKLTILNILF